MFMLPVEIPKEDQHIVPHVRSRLQRRVADGPPLTKLGFERVCSGRGVSCSIWHSHNLFCVCIGSLSIKELSLTN